jgi:transaldolase
MSTNPLRALTDLGQDVWYDFIHRELYRGPELGRLIQEDSLRGMTSNPTIFEKAIAHSSVYDDDIRRAANAHERPGVVFEALAVADVSAAADAFRPVFDATRGDSGFVSIEVQPHLAHDTAGTIVEVRRLWSACARPNVMVKIPGTSAGIPAIRQCLAEGININITLLFSVPRHREVMEAYLSALEERLEAGRAVEALRSVASFFVSRVDANVDKRLDAAIKAGNEGARRLRGKLAIANARIAYQAFEEVFASPRFRALAERGARVQKPLWASTSAKDPAYPPLYYVEALVAPRTVDTMPPETFATYRQQGAPQVRIRDDLPGAEAAFTALAALGIDFAAIGRELEEEGVKKFSESYDSLLATLKEKARALRA